MEESATLTDRRQAFDIQLLILAELVKMLSYADSSSGAAGDAIQYTLDELNKLCMAAPVDQRKPMLDAVMKTAKNKAFKDWAEFGYQLLHNAVYLVESQRQAKSIYKTFSVLGSMYGGGEYPERYVITHDLIEKLDGAAAAEKFRMEHLNVDEIRAMVVERALSAQDYALAEKLCREALHKRDIYGRPPKWAYYLEQIYTELGDREKQMETVRLILMKGEVSSKSGYGGRA